MELHIERLTLRLAGLSPQDGNRLAQMVGERLRAATPLSAAASADSLSVAIPARPGEALESMAQRIATQMLRELARST